MLNCNLFNMLQGQIAHLCFTGVTVPIKSVLLQERRFTLRPACFELQTFLRQVHRITPKWHWALKGQRCPIYMLQLHQPPQTNKFYSILLRRAVLELQHILRQVRRRTSIWPWTLKDQRYPIYIVEPSPNLHPISLYSQPFSSYMTFWDKCTEWHQNDFEQ